MSAMSAISSDRELKAYYQRKVVQGKNKMLVLNAIRNKILNRLFAVIRRETPFCKDFQIA